ncbi:hypothetical protein L7F22_003655 [Adiantum nelumboides]|nr:hypothetical protein [Adiantum nelumboides]
MVNFFGGQFPGRCFYLEFPTSDDNDVVKILPAIQDILRTLSYRSSSNKDEALSLLEGGLERNQVFLAIDNIWESNYDHAQKMLLMKGMPSSKILVTGRSKELVTRLLQSRRAVRVQGNESVQHSSDAYCSDIVLLSVLSLNEAEAMESLQSYSCFSYAIPEDFLRSLALSCFFGGQCYPFYLWLKGIELRRSGRASFNDQHWRTLISELQSAAPRDTHEDTKEQAVMELLGKSLKECPPPPPPPPPPPGGFKRQLGNSRVSMLGGCSFCGASSTHEELIGNDFLTQEEVEIYRTDMSRADADGSRISLVNSGDRFPKLQVLKLWYCKRLSEVGPGFCDVFPALQVLELRRALCLRSFPDLKGLANQLHSIDLSECEELSRFEGGSVCSFSYTALQRLHLEGCTKLERLHNTHVLRSLRELGRCGENWQSFFSISPHDNMMLDRGLTTFVDTNSCLPMGTDATAHEQQEAGEISNDDDNDQRQRLVGAGSVAPNGKNSIAVAFKPLFHLRVLRINAFATAIAVCRLNLSSTSLPSLEELGLTSSQAPLENQDRALSVAGKHTRTRCPSLLGGNVNNSLQVSNIHPAGVTSSAPNRGVRDPKEPELYFSSAGTGLARVVRGKVQGTHSCFRCGQPCSILVMPAV